MSDSSSVRLPDGKAIDILLVVHDEASARQLKAAWQQMGLVCKLNYIQDPDDALACLHRRGPYEGQRQPDIVIIPDGFEPEELRKLYRLEAGCFVSPPADMGGYFRFLERRSAVAARVLVLPNHGCPET